MPVARDKIASGMGQCPDSPTKSSNPSSGIITRLSHSIRMSRKGNYSVDYSGTEPYSNIEQDIEQPLCIQEDYYRVVPTDSPALVNGSHTRVGNGLHHDGRQAGVKDNDSTNRNTNPFAETNGFHGIDMSNLNAGGDNLMGRGLENRESTCPLNGYFVHDGDDHEHSRYNVVCDDEMETDNSLPPDFDRQGAKPKNSCSQQNCSDNGNCEMAAGAPEARQHPKQSRPGGEHLQNYTNVDLDSEGQITAPKEENHVSGRRNGMHKYEYQPGHTQMDDDIQEALKGPVLPPLQLPIGKHEPPRGVPKTPHIEYVYTKDEIEENRDIDEREEIEFASRAVGFRINPEGLVPSETRTAFQGIQNRLPVIPVNGATEIVDHTAEEDGILLLSGDGLIGAFPQDTSEFAGQSSMAESETVGISMTSVPPVVDRTNKPRAETDEQSDEEEAVPSDAQVPFPPPPIPPRVPARQDQEMDGVFNEFQEMRFRNAVRSLSLPRNVTPFHVPASEDQNQKVTKRKKLCSMFNKKFKRNSAFIDRPLPAIPDFNTADSFFRTRAATIASDKRRLPPPPPEDDPDDPPPPLLPKVPLQKTQEQKEVEALLSQREEFANSLRRISEFGWYWGPMIWDHAETRLEHTPDGSFLVRDSSDERHILSLSFRADGTTHHTRIEHQHGKFSFWSQPTSHGSTSVVDFIQEAMKHSHSGSFLYFLRSRSPGRPPAPVQLLYPVSRFQKARSLQHMCRFVIRRNIRLDHIDQLPLPKRLKTYIAESQYYTPEALER